MTGVKNYGAFVKFKNDLYGLIHVSELRSGFIKNISEVIAVGDVVRAQVIDVDEYTGKISLSLRTLEENPKTHISRRKRRFNQKSNKLGFTSLANKLDGWIEENTEYLNNQK